MLFLHALGGFILLGSTMLWEWHFISGMVQVILLYLVALQIAYQLFFNFLFLGRYGWGALVLARTSRTPLWVQPYMTV